MQRERVKDHMERCDEDVVATEDAADPEVTENAGELSQKIFMVHPGSASSVASILSESGS